MTALELLAKLKESNTQAWALAKLGDELLNVVGIDSDCCINLEYPREDGVILEYPTKMEKFLASIFGGGDNIENVITKLEWTIDEYEHGNETIYAELLQPDQTWKELKIIDVVNGEIIVGVP